MSRFPFLDYVEVEYVEGSDRAQPVAKDNRHRSIILSHSDMVELARRIRLERSDINYIHFTGAEYQSFIFKIEEQVSVHWRVFMVERMCDNREEGEDLCSNLMERLDDASSDVRAWEKHYADLSTDHHLPSTNLHWSKVVATAAAKRLRNEFPGEHTERVIARYEKYITKE